MTPEFIPQTAFVSPASDGERSEDAVLFVHGFTEGPEQFRPMAAWANALGLDAVALSLPGHGGTADDFARSGRRAWEECVFGETDRLLTLYRRIVVAGHSMGGLLALRTWARRPDGIAGIVCVGCPLHVWVSPRAVRDLLGVRYGRADASDERLAILHALNVAPGPTPGYVRWLPRLRDLFTLMADVRRELPSVRVPLLAVQGARDELVDARRSLRCFRRRVAPEFLRTLVLPHTTHFLYPPTDAAALREAFRVFCRSLQEEHSAPHGDHVSPCS